MIRLVVDVVFRGKVLETIPFDAPALRVGRMHDNEIVLDNLGVSRYHARLQRDDARAYLEDAGSENGCLVNGEPLVGRRALAPGDRIAIGKHELVVRTPIEGDPTARKPARRQGDAWEGARTYVAGMPGPPPIDEPKPAPPAPPRAPEPKEPSVMRAPSQPPETDVSLAASDDPSEIDFDFAGSLAEDEVESPATLRLDDAPPTAASTPMHAGFLVQKDGKLERAVAWSGDEMVAGRSSDCDIVLAQDEVSRRHARFERKGDFYEVRDQGSVNGTFVNGRRVERHTMRVGDVVQIEGYQLTFVLDREPIDAAFAAKPAAQPAPQSDTFAMTMLQEQMPHRPGFTEILAKPGPGEDPVDAAEMTIAYVDLAEVELLGVAEEVGDDAPAKPEPEAVPLRGSSRATSVQDLGRASSPQLAADRQLRFELRVRLDLLPPALRQAFEEAGASELVVPAELHLKA
jgi:pSer/pThr/pTyr-binding forkhead associated (FHA) protein